MRYLKVRWSHDEPDDPVLLLYELDDEGWDTRKVEALRDGSTSYADAGDETDRTFLSEVPIPPIEEIAADPQFLPEWIGQSEFEAAWEAAHRVAPASASAPVSRAD